MFDVNAIELNVLFLIKGLTNVTWNIITTAAVNGKNFKQF